MNESPKYGVSATAEGADWSTSHILGPYEPGVAPVASVVVARLVRDKELSELLAEAVRQGWRIERERKHVKCLAPDGHTMVVVGYSAHGNRALENARAELRRAGLRV